MHLRRRAPQMAAPESVPDSAPPPSHKWSQLLQTAIVSKLLTLEVAASTEAKRTTVFVVAIARIQAGYKRRRQRRPGSLANDCSFACVIWIILTIMNLDVRVAIAKAKRSATANEATKPVLDGDSHRRPHYCILAGWIAKTTMTIAVQLGNQLASPDTNRTGLQWWPGVDK